MRAQRGDRVLLISSAVALAALAGTSERGGRSAEPIAGAAAAARADLVVSRAAGAPASIARGGTLTLRVSVRNGGRARSRGTVVRAYLAAGPKRGRGDALLSGQATVPALGRGRSAAVSLRVTVPRTATAGRKVLLVCADDRRAVRERSETNNCRPGASLLVLGPVPIPKPGATPGPGGGPPSGGVPASGASPGRTGGGSTATNGATGNGGAGPGGGSGGTTPDPDPDPGPDPDPTKPAPTPGSPGANEPVPSPPPPPPAPALPETRAASMAEATSFLYEGAFPVQTGVTPGAIAARRVAVLRGRVLADDGRPLESVTVTVDDHPELGKTVSRTDGRYDLAVNADGPLVVRFERPGFLTADREVDPDLRDFEALEDVVLKAYDPRATAVAPGTATQPQVARSTISSDDSGERTSSLIFMPGTQATLRLPSGGTQTLGAFTVRATEYTEGPRGEEAMPGDLPPNSAYTYAADYTLDEAQEVDATEVTFDRAVPVYTDNFLDFPVGAPVPVGSYDREAGEWEAEQNGQVVKVLSVAGGRASLDVDGDGAADTGGKLDALGITAAELDALATFAAAGDELWRVTITHFSPWDLNWPYGPPDDAKPPKLPDPLKPNKRKPKEPREECPKEAGSFIGCTTRTLHEDVPVAGTGRELHYSSEHAPARQVSALEIAITEPTMPAGVIGVRLTVEIAGQTHRRLFSAAPNQRYTFEWDGKDGYGRDVPGSAFAQVTVGYEYRAVYLAPAALLRAFARFGAGRAGSPGTPGIARDQARTTVILTQSWREAMDGAASPHPGALGGWTLDQHHNFDPVAGEIRVGDGDVLRGNAFGAISNVLDAPVMAGVQGTGPAGIVAPSDGSVWYTQTANSPPTLHVRRIAPDGTNALVAAIPIASMGGVQGARISRAPDGIYLSVETAQAGVVFQITREGTVRKLTGGSATDNSQVPTPGGDDRPAAEVVTHATAVASGPDGTAYVAEDCLESPATSGGIRRIDGGGVLRRVLTASGRSENEIACPFQIAVAPDGAVYYWLQYRFYDGRFYQHNGSVIQRLDPDGRITTVVGGGAGSLPLTLDGASATSFSSASGVAAMTVDRRGTLLLLHHVQYTQNSAVYALGADGVLRVVLGAERSDRNGDDGKRPGAPALDVVLNHHSTTALAASPDGTVYAFSEGVGIRSAEPAIPAFGTGELPIPSRDGREMYVFDRGGRHLRTEDAHTRVATWRFAYDGAGRLTTVTDEYDRAITIERDSAGKPTAIVSPTGMRTTLAVNGDGNLQTITDPAGGQTQLTYAPGGLLATERDPAGGMHRFAYDDRGLLTRDENPDGIATTVSGVTNSERTHTVLTSPLGRTTTYDEERTADGVQRRTVTEPAAGRTVAEISPDGQTRKATMADGTVVETRTEADPLTGALAPYETTFSIRRPSGLTAALTQARTATRVANGDPATEAQQTNHRGTISTTTRDVAARTLQSTATGHQERVGLDAKGRTTSVRLDPALGEATFAYDNRGRLTGSTYGPTSLTYGYDAHDRLTSRTGPGGVMSWTYDARGAITGTTTPGANTYGFGRDGLGRMTSVTMPSGARHELRLTPAGRPAGDLAPGGGQGTRIAYDADGLPASVTLPSGRVTDFDHDAGGRVSSIAASGETTAITYAGDTERPATITRTRASGPAAGLALGWDGEELTSIESTGVAAGRYVLTWDQSLRLASSTLTAAGKTVPTSFARDVHGGITQHGPFTFTRGGPAASLTRIIGAGLDARQTWDARGRIATRSDWDATAERYAMTLTRDAAGRIATKVEKVNGVTRTWGYTYDADGRLTAVTRDGAPFEAYAYDANGNRTSRQIAPGAPVTATYRADDAITGQGATSYAVSTDGQLTGRGGDTFVHSARGELTSATVGGQTTTYAYDGNGRRVARIAPGGATTRYLYGDPVHQLRVTAIIAPDEKLTTLDYDDQGELFSYVTDGTRYLVSTDQVGSPVMVSLNGAVVKTVQYSAFGEVLSDSAPSVPLPLGYAGGVPDPATGFVRMGLRDYDPATGRFTTRDPIGFAGGQANLWAYAANEPIDRKDPLGLWSLGGSYCEGGFCGGGKFTWNDGHLGMCLEGGMGTKGASIDFSPTDDKIEDFKVYDKVSVTGKLGSLGSLELGGEMYTNGCKTTKFKGRAGACVLGTCVDTGRNETIKGKGIYDLFKDAGKLGVGAKAVMGACTKLF